MPIFVYDIAADQEQPSQGCGFIHAATIEEAVKLHGHSDVNVCPLPADAEWPGPPDKAVWAYR